MECINRERYEQWDNKGLEFGMDNKGLHTETPTVVEVPKGENLELKRRPNPLQINIIVTERQERENRRTRNTYTHKLESWP